MSHWSRYFLLSWVFLPIIQCLNFRSLKTRPCSIQSYIAASSFLYSFGLFLLMKRSLFFWARASMELFFVTTFILFSGTRFFVTIFFCSAMNCTLSSEPSSSVSSHSLVLWAWPPVYGSTPKLKVMSPLYSPSLIWAWVSFVDTSL